MRNFGEVDGVMICITDHALRRMVEMGLTAEQIRNILLEPEEVYESTKYKGDICHRVGDHTLAFTKKDNMMVVKTALYGTQKAWMRAWLDGKLPEDRHYSDMPTKLPRW